MSIKEHHRRMQVRADDARNGAWWRLRAACDPSSGIAKAAGVTIPDGFTSESLERQREASLFCHTICADDVRIACREFAMETGDENYVYGGTTETERRHLLKRRKADRDAQGWSAPYGGEQQSNVL